MRDVAHEQHEEFHVVLLDVRGRLLGRRLVARGSLTQCPVSPRDALRPAVRDGAHGVVFVHNHPSGDPAPSFEDADLTERLRAAAELVGVVARDHVIVATSGYYSFVEAGRWARWHSGSPPELHRLPQLLRTFLDGPAGTEEPVLPVALVLNKSLLKKIVIAVLIAAAETVLSGPTKSKVKR